MDARAEHRRGAAHELFALDVVDPVHALAVAVTVQFAGPRAAVSITVAGRGRSLVVLVEVPGIAARVHLRPLHLEDWAIAGVAGLGTGALALLMKLRRRGRAG